MIILQKLSWSNWFSYGPDNEIDFSANTLTQILGTNGVGKSSIPLILEEVLFGKNSKGVKKQDIPNTELEDKTLSANLKFTVDDVPYEVDLVRKSTLKLKLLKDGEDISFHTATATFKAIEGILGMDFKTFTQLIYQSSSANLQFLTATDAARKTFLIALFGLDRYTEIHNVYKDALKTANATKNQIKGSLVTTQAWIDKTSKMSFDKEDFKRMPEQPDEERRVVAEKEVQLKNIKDLNSKINNNNTYKDMLSKLQPTSGISAEETALLATEQDVLKKITIKQHEAKACDTLVKKLGSIGDKICPTCMQEIDVEQNDAVIKSNKDKSAEINKEVAELKKEQIKIKAVKAKKTKLDRDNREFEGLWSKIDHDMQTETLDADELSEEITNLRTTIKSITDEIAELEKENRLIQINNHKIDTVLTQIEEYNAELTKLTEELNELEELVSHLEILKKSFSTTGLISYKLEYLVKDLESTINSYLAQLSSGRFLVNFSLSGEKLVVGIIRKDKEVNINSLSTGQLARVNTSTLLAIRKLMAQISKSRINLLFLDETLSALDAGGRDSLIELLLSEKELNTFLVSHEYTHPLLEKVQVEMEDDISYITDG